MPKPLFGSDTKQTQFVRQQTFAPAQVIPADIQTQQSAGSLVQSQGGTSLQKVQPPTKVINIRDASVISSYGSNAQNEVSKLADQILPHVKTSHAGEVGTKLTSIITIARGMNISDLNGTSSKIPLIGGLIDSFKKSRQNFVAKFNSMQEQIDSVVKELDTTVVSVDKRIKLMDTLYACNMNEYHELEQLLIDGQAQLAYEQQEFEASKQEAITNGKINDPLTSQQLSDWDAAINRFESRLSDLKAIQFMAVQTMPEIRLIQNADRQLIDKFTNAKTLTIPAWKKQFILAVSLDEQKKASDLAIAVDNATNEFYQRNAELLGKNSVAVAKANQRGVIDLESLQKMQTTLITTFDEIATIEKEGRQKRADLAKNIDTMKQELYQKLVANKAT